MRRRSRHYRPLFALSQQSYRCRFQPTLMSSGKPARMELTSATQIENSAVSQARARAQQLIKQGKLEDADLILRCSGRHRVQSAADTRCGGNRLDKANWHDHAVVKTRTIAGCSRSYSRATGCRQGATTRDGE